MILRICEQTGFRCDLIQVLRYWRQLGPVSHSISPHTAPQRLYSLPGIPVAAKPQLPPSLPSRKKKMKELLYKSQDLHGVEKLGLHAPSLPAPVELGLHVPTGGSGWGLPTWSGSGVFWQQVIWQGGWKSEVLSEDRGWRCQWTAYSQCSLHLWSHWLFSSGLCNPFLLR